MATRSSITVLPRVAQGKTDVRDHYDELDRAYREIWGEHVHHGYWQTGRETPIEAVEALIDLVADRLGLRPGMRICDIGCGYGATGDYLARHYDVAVSGLTISSAQAKIAASRRPVAGVLDYLQGDWLTNGFADARFDASFAIESSEHMVDKHAFFAQAFRTLRPGGRLVVCAWLARTRPARWETRHLLEPICREGRLPGMGSREDYETLAAAAGFEAICFDDIGQAVRRTWSICARRLLGKLAGDPYYRGLVLSRGTRNRSFILSVPRLMLALRTGAMRYGVFVWHKPDADASVAA
jgi:tocopherol O-methyltransferase